MRSSNKFLSLLVLGAFVALAACSSDPTSDAGATTDAGGMTRKVRAFFTVSQLGMP